MVCMYITLQSGNTAQEDPSISAHTHTEMQTHNMHLYELLRSVYSGSMGHRDLEGLSKGISHIVTFSWDRRAQREDE